MIPDTHRRCPGNDIRILVVDDEPPILKLYERIIRNGTADGCNWELSLCSTAQKALDTIRCGIAIENRFSLVFMDIDLASGRDGIWAAGEISRLDPDIYIVFVTGMPQVDIKDISARIQAPDQIFFLQKPFTKTEIWQFVNSLGARWTRDREYTKEKADFEGRIKSSTVRFEKTKSVLEKEVRKREAMEAALEEKETQYRNIIEKNADAMLILDSRGIVLYINPAAEKLFDRKPGEFIGKMFGFSIISDQATEIEIPRRDGSMIVGEMRTVEVTWYTNPAFIVSIRDITLRKMIELQLKDSLNKYERTIRGTIQAMSVALEKRDSYTSGHQAQVARIATRIAKEMQLPEKVIEGMSMAAMIHDIGKIGIPAEILSKPTRLTSIEFALIKTHSEIGYSILQNIEAPWPIAEVVYQHHERINGTGYPQGLGLKDICIEARVISVADTLDAIASHRPYRAGLGRAFAVSEIKKYKGDYYDPDVVDTSLRLYEAGKLFDSNPPNLPA